MKFRNLLIIIFISLFAFGCHNVKTDVPSKEAETINWGSSQQDFEDAAEKGKWRAFYIHRKGCKACEKMKETFQDEGVIWLANEYFLFVDVDIEIYPEAIEIMDEKAVPAIIFYNPKTEARAQLTGYLPPEHLRMALMIVITSGL